MGIIVQKQRGVIGLTRVAKFSVVVFIISFAAAMVDTIWAVYLNSFLNNASYVGLLSGALTLVSLFSSLVLVPLVAKHNKSRLYMIALIVYFFAYLLFSINTSLFFLIIIAVVLTICYSMRLSVFGILMKDISSKNKMTSNVGLIYTFLNAAWVLGPLLGGYVLATSGVSKVFFLSSMFIFTALLLFVFSGIKDSNINRKFDGRVFKNFMNYFKTRERRISYFLSGGISFWWVLIYIYTPLMIESSDIGIEWIGYFLFAVAIPLILCEYLFSKMILKRGYGPIMFVGYLILAVCSILSFFFFNNIYIVLGLLVLASFGGAMIEPISEAYFFSILKNKDEETRFFGPYNSTFDFNLFLGKVIPAFMLLFFSFNYIFVVYSLVMISLSFLSLKAKG